MASLKEIKGRIGTVQSTRKITSAMKMVASAKLHHAQAAIENMLPYQQRMNHILTRFLKSADGSSPSPYAVPRPVKCAAIIGLSSNTSLCGAFNANVGKQLSAIVEQYEKSGVHADRLLVYPIGRKIEEAARKMGLAVQGSYQELAEHPNYQQAYALAEELMAKYQNGEIDQVQLLYHHFQSTGVHRLTTQPFLPIDLNQVADEAQQAEQASSSYRADYIVEPSIEEFITTLLPEVVKLQLFTAVLDSAASEHASRMMAMQTASDNADELLGDLTVQYNKMRQQAITNELLDIIGGSMR